MKDQCPRSEICNAPICPLDLQNDCPWYPDEDICARKWTPPAFVRVQRRISKRAKSRDTYYTYDMLNAIARVTKNTEGCDPTKNPRSWLKNYQLRRHQRTLKAKCDPTPMPGKDTL